MYLMNAAAEKAVFAHAPSPTDQHQWVLDPLTEGRSELKLRGKFPPRWLANLTSGLARQGISVQRGNASKLSPLVWQGTFEICAAGRTLPTLDFLALAYQQEGGTVAEPVRLDNSTIRAEGDALFVEVQGEDSVGFLMTLLKTFAFFSLYPAEVRIDTPAGRVHDRFWLKGLGGSAPTAELCAALRLELQKFER